MAEARDQNQAAITLGEGETVWFRPKYLRTRHYGRRFLPPWLTASPIGRILHRCYWLARVSVPETVGFSGPSPTGRFFFLHLEEGDRYFINLRNFVAITLPANRRSPQPMSTHLKGLWSLHCWLLGHPLPVIFAGPATVILYGQNLGAVSEEHGEHLISQVVAFDAKKPFSVLPTETDSHIWSDFANGLTLESRLGVEKSRLVVEQIIPDGTSPFRLLWRLLTHVALAAVIAAVIFLLASR